MSDSVKWMTVKEFSDAAGVSIQAIYQRLEKDLKSYLKESEDGKKRKYINSEALKLFQNSSDIKALENNIKALEQNIKALEKQLNDEIKRREGVETELKTVSGERDSFRQKYDALNKAAAVDGEKMHSLQMLLNERTAAKDKAEADNLELKNELDAIRKELTETKVKAAADAAALDKANSQIDDLKNNRDLILDTFRNEQMIRAGHMQIEMKQDEPKRGFFYRLFHRKERDAQ